MRHTGSVLRTVFCHLSHPCIDASHNSTRGLTSLTDHTAGAHVKHQQAADHLKHGYLERSRMQGQRLGRRTVNRVVPKRARAHTIRERFCDSQARGSLPLKMVYSLCEGHDKITGDNEKQSRSITRVFFFDVCGTWLAVILPALLPVQYPARNCTERESTVSQR